MAELKANTTAGPDHPEATAKPDNKASLNRLSPLNLTAAEGQDACVAGVGLVAGRLGAVGWGRESS
eukprot:3379915-Rhodomonas_salina.1